MLARRIHLFLPGIALGIVGFVLIGPGGARPVDAARVLGGPLSGAETLAWRVEAVRRMHGIERPLGSIKIAVDVETREGSHSSAEATTSPDGVAEVTLRWGKDRGLPERATVLDGVGEILAVGAPREKAWIASERYGGPLGKSGAGPLAIRVAAARGIFAAPFPDDVVVEVRTDDHAVRAASIELTIVGATFGPTAGPEAPHRIVVETDATGRARVTLTPSAHAIELEATVKRGADQGVWRGTLPVVPGAIWLDPSSTLDSLRIVSPLERPFAFVSIVGENARYGGAVAPLATDERGFSTATVSVPWDKLGTRPAGPTWVVLASDSRESGSGTAGWPLALSPDPFSTESRLFQSALLLDGAPAAEAAERARRRRARSIAVAVLALSGFAEALLLFGAARRGAPRANEVEVWESYGLSPPQKTPIGLLVVAIGTLVAALVAIGLALVWKLSE